MKTNLHALAAAIKLSLLTALIAMLGVVYVSQLTQNYTYLDETPRFVLTETQELIEDTETTPDQDSPGIIPARLVMHLLASTTAISNQQLVTAPRCTSLYHIRPRSPPFISLA